MIDVADRYPKVPDAGLSPAPAGPFEDRAKRTLSNADVLRNESALKARQKEAEEAVGFKGGFYNEWGTVEVRKAMGYDDPFNFDSYTPTDEERQEALEAVNYNLDRYRSILRGASTSKDFHSNLKIIKEVNDYRINEMYDPSKTGWIRSGIGSMFGDPTTLFGGVGRATGVARFLMKAGQGAAANVVSGQLNAYVSGDDRSILQDALTGAAYSAALEGVAFKMNGGNFSDALVPIGDSGRRIAKRARGALAPIGDAGRRAVKWADDILKDNQTFAGKSYRTARDYFDEHPIRESLEKALEATESKLPAWSVQGAYDKMVPSALKDTLKKIFKSERGFRDVEDRQYVTDDFTVEEYVGRYRKLHEREVDLVGDNLDKLCKVYPRFSRADVNHFVRKSINGEETPLDGNPLFEELKHNRENFYSWYRAQLQDRGMIKSGEKKVSEDGTIDDDAFGSYVEAAAGMYEHVSINQKNLADVLSKLVVLDYKTKTDKLAEKVKALLKRTVEDPKHHKLLRKIYEEEVYKPAVEKASETLNKKKGSKETHSEVNPKDIKVQSFEDWLDERAGKDAYGYVDQGTLTANRVLEREKHGLGIDYQTTRMPWKYTIEDSEGWSVDRLFDDTVTTMDSYNIRASADLAFNDVFGVKSSTEMKARFEEELREYAANHTTNADVTRETNAVNAILNQIYGHSGLDAEDVPSWSNAVASFIRNLTFFTKSAYMGMLNQFEVAEGIRAYGATDRKSVV